MSVEKLDMIYDSAEVGSTSAGQSSSRRSSRTTRDAVAHMAIRISALELLGSGFEAKNRRERRYRDETSLREAGSRFHFREIFARGESFISFRFRFTLGIKNPHYEGSIDAVRRHRAAEGRCAIPIYVALSLGFRFSRSQALIHKLYRDTRCDMNTYLQKESIGGRGKQRSH